jgi:hypothetical protein
MLDLALDHELVDAGRGGYGDRCDVCLHPIDPMIDVKRCPACADRVVEA